MWTGEIGTAHTGIIIVICVTVRVAVVMIRVIFLPLIRNQIGFAFPAMRAKERAIVGTVLCDGIATELSGQHGHGVRVETRIARGFPVVVVVAALTEAAIRTTPIVVTLRGGNVTSQTAKAVQTLAACVQHPAVLHSLDPARMCVIHLLTRRTRVARTEALQVTMACDGARSQLLQLLLQYGCR